MLFWVWIQTHFKSYKLSEIEFIEPRVMDAIPKQQLTEIRQLSKLVGGDVSLHGVRSSCSQPLPFLLCSSPILVIYIIMSI